MNEEMDDTSPKEFLKQRRPERFSDSVIVEHGHLDRAVLEHHISTLGQRSQELQFEGFARKLCEREVCPNLLEQTGPVAGGDGKVDSQTFPVAEQLAIKWFVGTNDLPQKERWAFAVSTQQDWKAKCRSDVRKIANTERGYSKIFCITSRYAKASDRSAIEDTLTKETGIDVRVLDISWILDRVFKGQYETLAIEELAINVEWRREVKLGPGDYGKTLRLEEIDDQLNELTQQTSPNLPLLVDLMLEEAVLSKELQRPEDQTKKLFDRASAVAAKNGTPHQEFQAHYQTAWAAFWWFDDIELYDTEFIACFDLAKQIGQAGLFGDLVTLLFNYTTLEREESKRFSVDIDNLRDEMTGILQEMSRDESRPSNSLLARVYVELIGLQTALGDKSATASIFKSLRAIAEESKNLVGFPFNHLHDWVSAVDDFFADMPEYEELLEYLVSETGKRSNDLESSKLMLRRGTRRLDADEPYQAIKLIGRSLPGLFKRESNEALVFALRALSVAYARVGLLWASRANLLMAASLATDEFWREGRLEDTQIELYFSLAILEIQLGRLHFAVKWFTLAYAIEQTIQSATLDESGVMRFEALLSHSVLRCSLTTLNGLGRLVNLFETSGLAYGHDALLFALGHDSILESSDAEERLQYFLAVRDWEPGLTISDPNASAEKVSTYKSVIVGCEFTIFCPPRSPFTDFAETLLAVIEGFFSTLMIERVMTLESKVEISISADDSDFGLSYEIAEDSGVLRFEILCSSFEETRITVEIQEKIHSELTNIVIEVFARVFRPMNIETALKEMLYEDKAIERSVSFGASLGAIWGENEPNHTISELRNTTDDFPLKRVAPWDKDYLEEHKKEDVEYETPQFAGTPPPDELVNRERLAHNKIVVQNLIKPRLWDPAGWMGVAYTVRDGVPGFDLIFRDAAASKILFDDLLTELGPKDNGRLRISFIRGVDKNNPTFYRVVISENMKKGGESGSLVQMVSRLCTMTPQDTKSLDLFSQQMNSAPKCLLGHVSVSANGHPIIPDEPVLISVERVEFKNAWQIGLADPEQIAIDPDEEPVVPLGMVNAPVHKVIAERRKRR